MKAKITWQQIADGFTLIPEENPQVEKVMDEAARNIIEANKENMKRVIELPALYMPINPD